MTTLTETLTARQALLDLVMRLYRFSEEEAIYFIDEHGDDFERALVRGEIGQEVAQ